METLPSKELLSEVLKTPIVKSQKADCTLLAYWDIYSPQHSLINIYELAHKCKEWANDKGYVIIQDTRSYTKVENLLTKEKKIWEDDDMSLNVDRIVQSCEWIMEQTK